MTAIIAGTHHDAHTAKVTKFSIILVQGSRNIEAYCFRSQEIPRIDGSNPFALRGVWIWGQETHLTYHFRALWHQPRRNDLNIRTPDEWDRRITDRQIHHLWNVSFCRAYSSALLFRTTDTTSSLSHWHDLKACQAYKQPRFRYLKWRIWELESKCKLNWPEQEILIKESDLDFRLKFLEANYLRIFDILS